MKNNHNLPPSLTLNHPLGTGLSVAAIVASMVSIPPKEASAAPSAIGDAVSIERVCETKPITHGTQQSCDYIENGELTRNVTFNRRSYTNVTESPEATVTRVTERTVRKDYLYKDTGAKVLKSVSIRPPKATSSYLPK